MPCLQAREHAITFKGRATNVELKRAKQLSHGTDRPESPKQQFHLFFLGRYVHSDTMKREFHLAHTVLALLLSFAFAITGCKKSDPGQVISDKVVQPEQALITGQMFVVTKARQNVVLGDEKLALVDSKKTLRWFKKNATEWSNTLATAEASVEAAQRRVSQSKAKVDGLFKDKLDKLLKTKKWHDDRMISVSASSPEWEESFHWSRKLDDQIQTLEDARKSSDAQKQLETDQEQLAAQIKEQARAFELINWPTAEHFWDSQVAEAITDSQGRFKFLVPAGSSNLMIVAKAERQLLTDKEQYWWLVDVDVSGKTTEVVLSNHNKHNCGVWFFEDKPLQEYMMAYNAKVDSAMFNLSLEEKYGRH